MPGGLSRWRLLAAAGAAQVLPTTAGAFDDGAFQSGAGVSGLDLHIAISGLIFTAALIWTAWLTLGAYRAWAAGDLDVGGLIGTALRSVVVLFLIGTFVR